VFYITVSNEKTKKCGNAKQDISSNPNYEKNYDNKKKICLSEKKQNFMCKGYPTQNKPIKTKIFP
jgi:hypothetical protein